VQSLIIHDEGRQLITDTLGGDLVGRKFPIDTIWLTSFRAGTLYHARLPLYEIAFRAIPEPVCQMLESALSIGDMMSIGFVSGSEILGNATILLRSSSPVPDTHLIEMYAQQASIALQRHHADEARKKSDEIFVNLAYNSPLPISLIEADGTYTFVNRSFVRLFGYDLNDFHNGREWFLLAFPESDYRRNVIASWKSDLERFGSGESRTRTYYVQCKDSVRREIVFRPVTLSDGKQCVLYEDITDQQKAQHEHRLLSWIVDSTDDAIIGKDSGGTIISWNRAAENLYGYSPGEIIGRHISLIIPPQKRDEMERIFEQIRQGDTVNSLATKRVRKDGTVIDVVVTISPIKADDGSYIGASTIAREISRGFKDPRNSNSYQGLKEITSLAYLTNALRCAPDGIAILDLSARCLWVNDSLAALVGSEGSDFLVGKSAAKFIATEQRKTVLDRLTEVRKKGHALFPLVLLSPYGRVMVDASISVVADDKGNPAGYLAIIRIMEKLPNHTTPPGKDKKKKR
jgi:PAS domain S-box-containing protein